MVIGTINTTVLTKTRMQALFESKDVEEMQILALQETRLRSSTPSWLVKIAREHGWGVACSEPPPPQVVTGAITNGGTAILWRRSLGKISVHRSAALGHRIIGIKSALCAYVSVYGYAQSNASFLAEAVEWSRMLGQQVIVIGDFNWRSAYSQVLQEDCQLVDMSGGTTTCGTTPTRCITRMPTRLQHKDKYKHVTATQSLFQVSRFMAWQCFGSR